MKNIISITFAISPFIIRYVFEKNLDYGIIKEIFPTFITVATFFAGFLIVYMGLSGCLTTEFKAKMKQLGLLFKINQDAYTALKYLSYSIIFSFILMILISVIDCEVFLLLILSILLFCTVQGFGLYHNVIKAGYLCYRISTKEEELKMGHLHGTAEDKE